MASTHTSEVTELSRTYLYHQRVEISYNAKVHCKAQCKNALVYVTLDVYMLT